MSLTKDELLALVRPGARPMSRREQLRLIVLLSVPAVVAQISSVAMQIIDAAMLGHLGTREAATVGLVATTIWLFGGLCTTFATGFSVQVAHHVGAGDQRGARNVVRQGFFLGLCFSSLLAVTGLLIAPSLPVWLGADADIHEGAAEYFAIVSAALPVLQVNALAAACLRCSGNIKAPSMVSALMCALDVLFNYLFIFHLHMGTAGAAYGTFLAFIISMSMMLHLLVVKDPVLRFSLDDHGEGRWDWWRQWPDRRTVWRACKIGSPVAIDRAVSCAAQVVLTAVISPFGAVALAANSFAVSVESLCKIPGIGIGDVSTTLVGQSLGANRPRLMRSFAWMSVALGAAVMGVIGLAMAVFAPEMMGIITPDPDVAALGSEVLRIEAWAEPFFAVSIVAFGAVVGSGRTLAGCCINLGSIWVLRVGLAFLLVPVMGLPGAWVAMCVELCFRGVLFLIHLARPAWIHTALKNHVRKDAEERSARAFGGEIRG